MTEYPKSQLSAVLSIVEVLLSLLVEQLPVQRSQKGKLSFWKHYLIYKKEEVL